MTLEAVDWALKANYPSICICLLSRTAASYYNHNTSVQILIQDTASQTEWVGVGEGGGGFWGNPYFAPLVALFDLVLWGPAEVFVRLDQK